LLEAKSEVKLSPLISNNMVLQRGKPIKIWGNASPGEKVTVKFLNNTIKIKTNRNGNWQAEFPSQQAGGPYSMEVTGSNKISVSNILIGDVWLCSGQSNMVHQLNIHDVTFANDIATANYPEIRQFWIPTLTSLEGPKADLPKCEWKAAVGEDVRPFSVVAYFFAKMIYEKYHVPIGIINSSVGGPPVEAWTSEEGLKAFPEILKIIQKNKDTAYVNSTNRQAFNANKRPEPNDKGLTGPVRWYDTAYIPKNWHNINVPGYWEDQGVKDLDGIVWYRREIDIPVSMTGIPARDFLGRIVYADMLYINGQQEGNTSYQYPQRRYRVPAGILKPGKNIFVVRVINHSGKGGFVPDKPYCIFAGKDTIDLKGTWQFKVADVFTPKKGPMIMGISAQDQPIGLYNAMIAPLINYKI
jgi:sialate O-acetylesterase